MTEVLRCPFCDSVADLHVDEDSCAAVICAQCDCQTTWFKPGYEEEAASAWNRRAARCNDTAPVAPIGDERIREIYALKTGLRAGLYDMAFAHALLAAAAQGKS